MILLEFFIYYFLGSWMIGKAVGKQAPMRMVWNAVLWVSLLIVLLINFGGS